jgi:NADH-quinone oxidoreductase subunit L
MTQGLILAVVLAPLLACAACVLLARVWPGACGAIAIAGTAAALAALLALGSDPGQVRTTWLAGGALPLEVGLRFDALAKFMAFLVAGIALAVQVYSLGYMRAEAGRGWFFALLCFFVASMLALVMASDFPLLFAAWEAVGLASCLLVGFHLEEREAIAAALRVFLVTRVGDLGLLLAWLLAWRIAGTSEIAGFLAWVESGRLGPGEATLLAALFLWGAMGKSAQLPLAAWLSRAMAGPTPVSALIHSATMVAGGVYLVLRLYPLYVAAPLALGALMAVGLATAFFSALVATAQSDLKRVLAWSTSSQLGEMMFALGLAAPGAALLHLGAHASFKSALFIAAGDVERSTGTRDLAALHDRAARFTFPAAAFVIAALALAGVPPLSGARSEEMIGEAAAAGGAWRVAAFLVVAALAGAYIGRAMVIVGRAGFRGARPRSSLPRSMRYATAALVAGAAVAGGLIASWTLGMFGSPAEARAGIRIAAAAAAMAGLALGAFRGNAAPGRGVFGSWPCTLDTALASATEAPGRLARALAARVERCERAIDAWGLAIAADVMAVAAWSDGAEWRVDRIGRAPARAALSLARATELAESRGFACAADALAAGLTRTGERLHAWESGRIYAYLATLFAWLAAAAFLAVAALAMTGGPR